MKGIAVKKINRPRFCAALCVYAALCLAFLAGIAHADTFADGMKAADRGDAAGVDQAKAQLQDPVARALLEWALLRKDGLKAGSARLQRFLQSYAQWPGLSPIKFKLEQAAYFENMPPAQVLATFKKEPPRWPHGRIAYARALRDTGEAAAAQAFIRDTWRSTDLATSHEQLIRALFPNIITRADHAARMARYVYAEKADDALRAAADAADNDRAIAKACAAVLRKAPNAGALLDSVPAAVRKEPLYLFCRIQFLRRAERFLEAIALLPGAPGSEAVTGDGDAWWVERRLLARAALDRSDPQTAYKIVAQHGSKGDVERMEAEFHAGWIALRFLKDPKKADKHFALLQADAVRPISVARGAYWRARAAEANGLSDAARGFYQAAAQQPTTFYGQLALLALGRNELALRAVPKLDPDKRRLIEGVDKPRALQLLINAGETGKARLFVNDLAAMFTTTAEMTWLAAISTRMDTLQASVYVGKEALVKGLPLETYAFPVHGLPPVPANAGVERALVLGIARQESTFDASTTSGAGARGIFQILPNTGAYVARKNNIPWQASRIADPPYNMQLGALYLAELLSDFNGSYILAFAAYNAGKTRVKEWLAAYGDPRTPGVDAIDWIERIPFSETRNYVMRVMENMMVYRARLSPDQRAPLTLARDLRRGGP